jgi:hypothetical protein
VFFSQGAALGRFVHVPLPQRTKGAASQISPRKGQYHAIPSQSIALLVRDNARSAHPRRPNISDRLLRLPEFVGAATLPRNLNLEHEVPVGNSMLPARRFLATLRKSEDTRCAGFNVGRARLRPSRAGLGSHQGRGHETRAQRSRFGRARLRPSRAGLGSHRGRGHETRAQRCRSRAGS